MLCDCMFLYRNVVHTNTEIYYQLSIDSFRCKLTSSGDVTCYRGPLVKMTTGLAYGALRYSVMASSVCSISRTRRCTVVANPVIGQEWGMNRIKIATNEIIRGNLWHRYSATYFRCKSPNAINLKNVSNSRYLSI